MDWKHLRDGLVNQHFHPQEVHRIDRAIAKMKDGMDELMRMGHPFQLIEGLQRPPQRYPRYLYHFEKAPNGFLCLCAEDHGFLGEGWFDTFWEAQHADGMGMQFRRGGVFPTRALPAVVVDDDSELSPLDRMRKSGHLREDGKINE